MNSKDRQILKHQPDWEETKARFKAWWARSKIGRPLMKINAWRDRPLA
jgi:hypothetical protein